MGGGGVPGPERGDESVREGGSVGQSGAEPPGPEAASEEDSQHIVVTGWPRQLGWSDFRDIDRRPAGESEDAQINPETQPRDPITVRIGRQWRLKELELAIVVDREDTWAVRDAQTNALLNHEQRHFDIQALIVGRELAEELRGIRARSNGQLETRVQRANTRAEQRAQVLSDLYDVDTSHGLDAERQAVWDRQIQNAIDNHVRLTAP